jgi:hypothetical protein
MDPKEIGCKREKKNFCCCLFHPGFFLGLLFDPEADHTELHPGRQNSVRTSDSTYEFSFGSFWLNIQSLLKNRFVSFFKADYHINITSEFSLRSVTSILNIFQNCEYLLQYKEK